MPPKKAAPSADGTDVDDGSKAFRWTAENDRKLLILTLNRTLSTDDYHRLVEAMPGTNYNGVRIRVSKMRIEQRKMFEDLGWESLDSANIAGEKKPATLRKRAAKKSESEDNGEDGEKPAKKVKKGGKKAAKTEEKEEDLGGIGVGVKEEMADD